MTSPARRNLDRKLARIRAEKEAAAGRAPVRAGSEASAYELRLAALGEDLARLKMIQSVEAKIELKRELIAAYDDWVAGVFAAEEAAQDDIFTTMMIWRLDIGDYDRALEMAELVFKAGMTLPERYQRDAHTFVAEMIAEAALKGLQAKEPLDVDTLQTIDAMTAEADMPDQVRAKLKKALGSTFMTKGLALDKTSDGAAAGRRYCLECAREYLRRALVLHDRCGVKKDIERLDRELAAANDV